MKDDRDIFETDYFATETDSTTADEFTPPLSPTILSPIPDHAEAREYFSTPTPQSVETAPCPGQTYMIRDPTSRRLVTLKGGELRLEPHAGYHGGFYWECVETKGWLGFRNPAYNVYIGHNGRDGLVAEKKHHQGWEWFCVRRHQDGGYILLSRWWDDLWKVDIAEDGQKLIRRADGGVAWEFEKV
ncbi:hypothetical protein GGR54DRAFT_323899 [Hypoxylon sp. NC1633]|nr:hypothetical protein GGR54DRAFT_323899 [Hypoxylon sp. NC1633]